MTTLIETVRVRGGVAPLWGLHLRRLLVSCRALGVPFPPAFEVPAGVDRIRRLEVSARGVAVTDRPVPDTAPVALVTARTPHRPYPHKTTARDAFAAASAEADREGADDALLLTPEGWVAEATIWTLFWWEDDRIATPSLDLGVLPGVARTRLDELVGLVERRVRRSDLAGRPLFLANAARGVVPVRSLDGEPVPGGPGTAMLAARLWG